jgi:uncharacterized protein (DUF2141 family)
MAMIRETSSVCLALMLTCALAPITAGAEDVPNPPSDEPRPDVIVIEVSGLQADDGQIGCAIFRKEDGFPDEIDKAMKQVLVKPKAKKATCRFEGYEPGTYAISVMHDLDMNGELNTSFVGKPKEPWGVSNNAPMQRFGPPLYKDCTFQYASGEKTLKVRLQD